MPNKRGKGWYYLPSGEYPPEFLKALAMASHIKVIEPSELEYFLGNAEWGIEKITIELMERVKKYKDG